MEKKIFTVLLDNNSYTKQILHVAIALFPLLTLGELTDNKPIAVVAGITVGVLCCLLIASFFFKQKTCPQWLRDTVSDTIFNYLFFCFPAIMCICSGINGWPMLYLGIGIIILDLATCKVGKKVKADALNNLENIHALKAASINQYNLIDMLFRNKWNVVNKLCNIYYERKDSSGSLKFIVRDIETELEDFRTRENIANILTTTDKCLDGVISKLKEQCAEFLKDQDIEFIGLIFSGLSVRAVCYIVGIQKDSFYQKKNRLLRRIAESNATDKELFIDHLSKFTK